MTMTVADVGRIGNQSKYTPSVTEFQDSAATAAGVVGRRLRQADGAGAGLSKRHISPFQSNQFRDSIKEVWDDTPKVAQLRNSAGSLVSIEGRAGSVEWSPDGSFLKVSKPSLYAVKSSVPSTSKRAAVSGFSAKSANRLRQLCAKLKRAYLPFFLTLTYPGEYPGSPDEWKRHLDVFLKRLGRRFPAASAIWKLEAQSRGAPHFHLLLWLEIPGVSRETALLILRDWVRLAWWQVVGSGDDKHFRAGTSVEPVRSWGGVCAYTAKGYMGKAVLVDDDSWGRPGRFWGVFNRAALPVAVVMVATLYYNEACDLLRWMRRFRAACAKYKIKGRDSPSMWLFVADPDVWVTNFDRFTRGL